MPLDLKVVATLDAPGYVRNQVGIAAAEPVYRLLGGADRLQAVYPDAKHDFPTAARHQAYEFLDRLLMPSS